MNVASWITFAYAAIVMLGGIVGYAMAKSIQSLIAGVVSGIVLLVCALTMNQGNAWSVPVAVIVMGVLMWFFGKNYRDGKKVRNLVLAILSILALLGVLVASR